jgi:hypothetical protein
VVTGRAQDPEGDFLCVEAFLLCLFYELVGELAAAAAEDATALELAAGLGDLLRCGLGNDVSFQDAVTRARRCMRVSSPRLIGGSGRRPLVWKSPGAVPW